MAEGASMILAKSQKSHRERDDAYRAVVAVLNPSWRVIECHHGIQWILQRRDGYTGGLPRWTGDRYFTTRAALVATCQHHCGQQDPLATEKLAALPKNFVWGKKS